MVARLPPDIMLLVCEELGNLQEFMTLFNCALSSKQLADPALLWLYRIHHQSPIRSANEADESKTGTSKDATFRAQKTWEQPTVSKWALQWRSIILSSLGQTAYPYCLYTRSLELSNLSELFDDLPFAAIRDEFFAGEMTIFLKWLETPMQSKKSKRRPQPRLDAKAILDLVGESISKYAGESAENIGGMAALEELSGHLERDSLTRWVVRLSRLKSLRLWDGAVLNKDTADAIRSGCIDFDSLNLYNCKGNEADADLADFLFGLRPNTMRFLHMISSNDLGSQTFVALSSHGLTLKSLNLGSLQAPAVRSLSLLKGCTALQTLTLELDGAVRVLDLEATENKTYLEIIAWLSRCVNLKNIRFVNVFNGPAIMASICLQEKIRLEKLDLINYELINNRDFHLSLSHQTSLDSLELRADASGSFRDDIDILVSSLCKLTNLRYLSLIDTSDYFANAEIKQLAGNLLMVEELTVSGLNIDDAVWSALSNLHQLRALSFPAMTSFSFGGILDYVSSLQSSNAGLELSIMSAHVDYGLSPDEIGVIKMTLAEKVDGNFQFMLWRDPAESEFDSDSD